MNETALHLAYGPLNLEPLLRFLRSERYTEVYNGLIILMLVAIGTALSMACVKLTRHLSNRSAPDAQALFAQLCRAHYLSGSQQRQLEQLAVHLGLTTPAVLLIDASLWRVDELVSQGKILPQDRDRMLKLQRTLYEEASTPH